MQFIHVWALGIGLFALGMPWIIHWFTKPKPQSYGLSTIRFLQEVLEQRKSRSRLRDWLILLLRMLCIGLISLAIARPIPRQGSEVQVHATPGTVRVVILDHSQSMAAGSGGVTSWSRGLALALPYLQADADIRGGVILAGAQPNPVFDQLSSNFAALREAIAQSGPVAERCDGQAALELAAKFFQKAEGAKTELIVISDFQRTNWGMAVLDGIPPDTRIQFHNVAGDQTENVAIESIRFDHGPIRGQPVQLEIGIANYSDRTVQARCRIQLDKIIRNVDVSLEPQNNHVITESIVFEEPGWIYGSAKLIHNLDVLPDDDERWITAEVRPPVRGLLISRQNENEIPSSSFFLSNAVAVALGDQIQSVPSAVRESQSNAERRRSPLLKRVHTVRDSIRTWPSSEILVIDHPGLLGQEQIQFVTQHVRRGGSLLYVASEPVDANNLKQIVQALGSNFQPPIEWLPPSESRPRKNLLIQNARDRDGPLKSLASGVTAMFPTARIMGGLETRKLEGGLADQILMELSDRSALLTLTDVGVGRVAVLNADLGQSNWTVQPSFVPLIVEMIQSLSNQNGLVSEVTVGESLVRNLPGQQNPEVILQPVTLQGKVPEGKAYGRWEWDASQGAMVWTWPQPSGTGIYALQNDTAPVAMVATTIPALESNLDSLTQSILQERIAGERTIGYATAEMQQPDQDSLWTWIVMACIGVLLSEVLALRWSRM